MRIPTCASTSSGSREAQGVVDRFLRYSLERGQKICVVLMNEAGAMEKMNLLVTAIDEDGAGFSARRPGRKMAKHYMLSDVLTAAYARGDQGALE